MKQIENKIASYRGRPSVNAKELNPYLNEFGEEVLDEKPHIDLLASPVPLPISEQISNLTRISRASRLAFLDELDEDDFGDDISEELDDEVGMTPSEWEVFAEKIRKSAAAADRAAAKRAAARKATPPTDDPIGDAVEGSESK